MFVALLLAGCGRAAAAQRAPAAPASTPTAASQPCSAVAGARERIGDLLIEVGTFIPDTASRKLSAAIPLKPLQIPNPNVPSALEQFAVAKGERVVRQVRGLKTAGNPQGRDRLPKYGENRSRGPDSLLAGRDSSGGRGCLSGILRPYLQCLDDQIAPHRRRNPPDHNLRTLRGQRQHVDYLRWVLHAF